MTATDKLAGIKPGDRVRVTFEADVQRYEDGGVFLFRDGLAKADQEADWWGPRAMSAPTFHIERLEKPLKVDDRVEWKVTSTSSRNGYIESSGRILAIVGGHAMVARDGFIDPVVVDIRLLERIA